MSANKVVIIGAGCAGLSAAYNLKKQGVDFVLFEAGPHVGGRCRNEYDQGYQFGVGAGSTEPQWETTFQYLKELGLEDRIYSIQKQSFGFVRKGKIRTVSLGGTFMDSLRVLPQNIAFIFSGIPLKAFVHLLKILGPMNQYLKRIDVKTHNYDALAEISDMSTEDFCLKYGAPLASEWFFHTLLGMMVLARPKDVSIAHPLTLFSLMKGMRSLRGGLGLITEGLYNNVKDNVRLNTPVKKVVIKNNKVIGVETKDGFIAADQVISGLDSFDVRKVIPDLPETMRKPLETCKYSSTYNYQFALETLPVDTKDRAYLIVLPPGTDTFLDFIALGPTSEERHVVMVPTRGWEDDKLSAMSPEERRLRVIKEVQRFVPSFPSEPRITKCFRWDRAINIEAPGQHNAIRDLIDNHMHDVTGLYLSGEYLFLLACTEGAFLTGKKAAETVVDDLRNERL